MITGDQFNRPSFAMLSGELMGVLSGQDKTRFILSRQDMITINVSSRALLSRLFENKCIKSTYVQQLQKKTVCDN